MRGSFNVQHILRQLGLTDVTELPIVEAIQPVVAVGDASAIAPSLLPATAYGGCQAFGNGTTTRPGFRIVSGYPGTYVRDLVVGGGIGTITWNVGPVADAILAATQAALQLFNVGPMPITAEIWRITVLIGGDNDPAFNPNFLMASAVPVRLPDVIYLPPAHIMDITFNSVTAGMSASAVLQDAIPNLTPTG